MLCVQQGVFDSIISKYAKESQVYTVTQELHAALNTTQPAVDSSLPGSYPRAGLLPQWKVLGFGSH